MERNARVRDAGLASLGGAIILLMAWLLSSFQPDPTLIDRAFPVLALSLWILASRTGRSWRDGAMLLVPMSFAVELAVADPELRLLLLGATLAAAGTAHIASLEDFWEPFEILTALAILIPLRIVVPAPGSLGIEAIMVAGGALLWTELRREAVPPALTAAGVVLLSVSIPTGSVRLATVPLVVVALVHAIRRDSWAARIVTVAAGLVVARWLGVTSLLILLVAWLTRGGSLRGGHGAFVPSMRAVAGNTPAVVAPLPFFPSLFTSPRAVATLAAPIVLAMVVRPSLAAPIVAVGLVAGCALWTESESAGAGFRRTDAEGSDRGPAHPTLFLPSLILLATIMLFFPWSGAIVARPPSPVPLIVMLAVASLALLPAVAGRGTPFVALAVVAVVVMTIHDEPDRRREVGRSLQAGERISLRLDGAPEEVEIRISGGNLADRAAGLPLATVEVIDAKGRGYSREVVIGEVADWGAFRPGLVLRTLNPRPDAVARIEGWGAASWVQGTGRIGFPAVAAPRWIVVSASPDLEPDARVIIEEIRTR